MIIGLLIVVSNILLKRNTKIEQELRSLKDLTKHLTARADDSHATPVKLKFKIKIPFNTNF